MTKNPEDGGRADATEAIRAARAGRLATQELLRSLLATQVIIPLADPPVMDGARLLSWKPATVSRDADGQQFVVVFTDEELDVKYVKWRPEYAYRLRAGADWLTAVLPAGHGILFNLGGGEIMFEWPASDILAYRAAATGVTGIDLGERAGKAIESPGPFAQRGQGADPL